MSTPADANSCLSIQPPSQPTGQKPSPHRSCVAMLTLFGAQVYEPHHELGGKLGTSTTVPHLCGFQGAACSWLDKADARLSLRAGRPSF